MPIQLFIKYSQKIYYNKGYKKYEHEKFGKEIFYLNQKQKKANDEQFLNLIKIDHLKVFIDDDFLDFIDK